MEIREIKQEDAEAFVSLIKQVDSESEFMLFEAGERTIEPEQQRERIQGIEASETSTIFVAEDDSELIGYLVAIGNEVNRKKHSVYLVIGIKQTHQGRGVGTELFKALEEWASERNIHRLELNVSTRNEGGLALYRKFGFEVEGLKRNSMFVDGEYVDEYYMGKLL